MSDSITAERDSRTEAPAAERLLARMEEERDEPRWLARRRREAWERYCELPMPTRKSEEWRYTDISGLQPESFSPALPTGEEETDSPEGLPEPVRRTLERDEARSAVSVSTDGVARYRRVDPELTEQGVVYAPIRMVARDRPELLEEFLFTSDTAPMEEKLWTLHVAALSGGYLLYVPERVEISAPVHSFRWIGTGGLLVSSHSLIVAKRGARVTCIDEFVSPDLEEAALSLGGVELFGQEGAEVRYLSLQRYGRGVRHFTVQHATTGRDATLSGCNVTLGADLSRADVTSHLVGPGSSSEMLALWFGDREQHFDHHTLQHHAAPHAHSDLLYKGALTDRARSVFRGLIRVDKGAQLTDAYQTNRNLLLSKECNATTLPNLEIEADDVRCSHGATVGQVDEGQLFYLMSRGLDRTQAERLLVFGFFDEVLARIGVEGVKARIREAIEEKIGL